MSQKLRGIESVLMYLGLWVFAVEREVSLLKFGHVRAREATYSPIETAQCPVPQPTSMIRGLFGIAGLNVGPCKGRPAILYNRL